MEPLSLTSLQDVIGAFHACTGDPPPPVVGASAVLVDSGPGTAPSGGACVYVFGGRLVSTRVMTNDLYQLDLDTMVWRKIQPAASPVTGHAPSLPHPRYFHSADLWQGKIVFCGGMGLPRDRAINSHHSHAKSSKTDGLVVLDEVVVFDLATMTWDLDFVLPPAPGAAAGAAPAPRYAHLSSIATDYLVILGGQDNENNYVQEMSVLDLQRQHWVRNDPLANQCGSYRSMAVSSPLVIYGPEGEQHVGCAQGAPPTRPLWLPEKDSGAPRAASNSRSGSSSSLALDSLSDRRNPLSGKNGTAQHATSPSVGSRSSAMPESAEGAATKRLSSLLAGLSVSNNPSHVTSAPPKSSKNELHMLPTAGTRPRQFTPSRMKDEPSRLALAPIMVYSNYNFADVKRELESMQYVLTKPAGDAAPNMALETTDYSERMGHEHPLPPGLRFPNGFILGSHMIISGTYLANTTQTFSLWVLHLPTLTWSRLDTGSILGHGSWNRALLHRSGNRLLVFGDRTRDLVTDYNRRQNNWSHVVSVELEALGVYEPPLKGSRVSMVARLGLEKLAASMSGTGGDSTSAVAALSQTVPSHSPSQPPSANLSRTSSAAAPEETGDASPTVLGESGASRRESSGLVAKVTSPGSELLYLTNTFGGRGDFEIVCSDGVTIGVSRAILERRWPWFRQALTAYRAKVVQTVSDLREGKEGLPAPMPVPPLQSGGTAGEWGETDELHDRIRADVRITPRRLHLPEPSVVGLALMEYIYTQTVCTRTQRHPGMLCMLLLLGGLYSIPGLTEWAAHAAHTCLATEIAVPPPGSSVTPDLTVLPLDERQRIATQFYETAALAGLRPLQLRALRTALLVNKWRDKSRSTQHGSARSLPASG